MKKLYSNIVLLILLLICYKSIANESVVKIKLQFDSTKIQIGKPFKATLVCKHSAKLDLLMPDSIYNFEPFLCLNKKEFETKTINNISTDSVIYSLTTFSIDSIQKLKLPVWYFNHDDTTIQLSNECFIFLNKTINQDNSNVLKADTQYVPLSQTFDYVFWLTIFVVILFILFVAFVFFGKGIKKQFFLYLGKLNFDRFLADFERKSITLSRNHSTSDLDKLLGIWKKYLEEITQKPIKTFTSKEIAEFIENESLYNALSKIDRAIYGGEFTEEIISNLTILKIVAKEYYLKKQEEVRNA